MARLDKYRLITILCLAAAPSAAGGEVVLLDFTSPTCGPCQQMRGAIRQLAASGYRVHEVDVSRDMQTASRFEVRQWPTFIVLVDKKEYARISGVVSYQQLAGMMNAAESSARRAESFAENVQTLENIKDQSRSMNPGGRTFMDQPQPGRIVEIDRPRERPYPAQGGGRPAGQINQASSSPTPSGGVAPADLLSSSVRLAVIDPTGKSSGTGTIIDAREGEALIITCGHIFRESQGKGEIAVTLFDSGPNGALPREVVSGQLIGNFNLERDLALVRIGVDRRVRVAPVAPAGTALLPNAAVTSVGCNNGANPTAITTRITAVDRYQGPPNVEIAGAPVEGRSGGGLFNQQGQVIGVCFAADPEGDEGLYASLPSLHAMLDELHLTMVYESPSGLLAGGETAMPSGIQFRGQDPTSTLPGGSLAAHSQPAPTPRASSQSASPQLPTPPMAAPAGRRPTQLSLAEQAALDEIQRSGAQSEVICIIRPKTADGKSQIIKLNGASPEFLRSLTGAFDRTASRPVLAPGHGFAR